MAEKQEYGRNIGDRVCGALQTVDAVGDDCQPESGTANDAMENVLGVLSLW